MLGFVSGEFIIYCSHSFRKTVLLHINFTMRNDSSIKPGCSHVGDRRHGYGVNFDNFTLKHAWI